MCYRQFTEAQDVNSVRFIDDSPSDQSISFSEMVYMVPPEQQDTIYVDDTLIIAPIRPSSAGIDNTNLSTSNA